MRTWEAELATLVAERGRALVGYAYALAGDLGQAKDLVQDALVKTFSRSRRRPAVHVVHLDDDGDATGHDRVHGRVHGDAPAVGDAGSTEAYVRRAILTLFIDDHRRHLVSETGHSRSPDHAATAYADVTAALSRLGRRERAAVVLRHYADLTVPQIARTMNVAEGTVKRYLADGTATLRAVLGDPSGDRATAVAPAPATPAATPTARTATARTATAPTATTPPTASMKELC